MNQVTLIGRLTKDPELKYTQGGKAFCKFSIAVTREFNREEADFIGCVAWDKRAETIAEYLRSYEQNGENKWITEVIVDKFDFIDTNSNSTGGNYAPQSGTTSNNQASEATSSTEDNEEIIDDDDFPF
jgi:single-strand DNA-binding protein